MSANGKRLPLEVVASSILKTLRDFAWLSKKSDENLRMHTLLVEILNRSFGLTADHRHRYISFGVDL